MTVDNGKPSTGVILFAAFAALVVFSLALAGCGRSDVFVLNNLPSGPSGTGSPSPGTGLTCSTASVLIRAGVSRAVAGTKTTVDATPLLPGGNPVPDQCNVGKRVAWTVPGPCHLENDIEGFDPTLALESEGTCGPIVAVVDSIRSNAITVTVTK